MKLHSLKIKQIVAKVLYLLASRLCMLADKVLDKLIDACQSEVSDQSIDKFNPQCWLDTIDIEGGDDYDS